MVRPSVGRDSHHFSSQYFPQLCHQLSHRLLIDFEDIMKSSIALSFILLIIFQLISDLKAISGSVVLDSITFDKIIRHFKTTLVKFDIQYPYGPKHLEFESVAKMATNTDLLLAEVGVQEFGDKDNMDLSDRFGIKKDDFPVLKLFIDGNVEKPIDFDLDFTSDSIIQFIRNHSGIRVQLSSCLQEFDVLAERFMDNSITEEERNGILSEAKQKSNELSSEEHQKWADIYIKLMSKVVERGNQFIDTERQRIEAIVSKKLTENKRKEMKERLNILFSFQTQPVHSKNTEL